MRIKQGNSVNTKEMNTGQLTAIVANLAELHEWELDHCPLLSTLTGRHLYFRIAQRAVGDRALLSKALKDLMGGSGYTEKALRIRMREMEAEGYIASVNGEDDARSKYLMPTEKFYEAIYIHADQVRRIFEKDFLMIEKT
jgi:DNA-binding MarR family transcriptional regulator